MAHYVQMPEVSVNATSATLQAWNKKVGEQVRKGDVLGEVETDKAIVEIEAEADGTLAAVYVQAGQEVPVGASLGIILAPGETLDAKGPASAPAAALVGGAEGQRSSSIQPPLNGATRSGDAERIRSSPLARRLAAQHSVALESLQGSGPAGRIVKKDVLDALGTATPAPATASSEPAALAHVARSQNLQDEAPAFIEVPHSNLRKTIARRLTESKQSVPHFYLSAQLSVEKLLALREEINAGASQRVSVNDMLVKVSASALQLVPEMNVTWTETAMRKHSQVDIAIAVSTDEGLFTPVMKDVANKRLLQVQAESMDLASRARQRKLKPAEYEGGSFCISNLGMKGVQGFTAIINPPQSAILAVGAARSVPVVTDGAVQIARVVTFNLSVDHRCVDGAVAADWMSAFAEQLDNPLRAVL